MSCERPRRGRPPVPVDEALTDTLRVRLRVADRERIERAAAAADALPSEWARRVLLRAAARARPR